MEFLIIVTLISFMGYGKNLSNPHYTSAHARGKALEMFYKLSREVI